MIYSNAMVAARSFTLKLLTLSAFAVSLFLSACTQTSGNGKAAPQAAAAPHESVQFLGSEACVGCHEAAHKSWKTTWMARTVRIPGSADLSLIENSILCGGMAVDYVLGGRINLRYLQRKNEDIIFLPCEYDTIAKAVKPFRLHDWQDFSFGERCAACHTTGFDADKAEWTEMGVGCESCHGPSSRHGDYKTAGRMTRFSQISAVDEGMICSSCHLQGGFSTKSDRRFPEGYLPGMDLFSVYRFPWESLDASTAPTKAGETPANPVDVHQKILMKHNLDGESDLRCTTCHAVHQESHEKHKQLSREDYCYQCHKLEDGKFGLKDYEVECPVCEF